MVRPRHDCPRTCRPGVRRHHGEGVRAARRRDTRRHPARPRVRCLRRLPAERPGDPGAPLPQDRGRLGRGPRARAGGGAVDERCSRRTSPTSSRSPRPGACRPSPSGGRSAWPPRSTRCRPSTTPASPRSRRRSHYCDQFPLDDLPSDAAAAPAPALAEHGLFRRSRCGCNRRSSTAARRTSTGSSNRRAEGLPGRHRQYGAVLAAAIRANSDTGS